MAARFRNNRMTKFQKNKSIDLRFDEKTKLPYK